MRSSVPSSHSLPRLMCDGRGEELMSIVFYNTLLSILTLGFYRFWGRTKLRRYLWSRTLLDNEPFEYLGTGGELLLGFLRLCVLFFLLVGAIFGVAFAFDVAERLPGVQSLYFVLVYTAGVVLFPLALYLSWRYRLSRTSWRGIRASLRGSAFSYFLRWFGWTLLAVLSLGLLIPARNMALRRYFLNHCTLGDQSVSFDGKGRDLFPAFLLSWGATTIVALLATILAYSTALSSSEGYFLTRTGEAVFFSFSIFCGVWALLFPLLYLVFYKKKEMHYTIEHISWSTLRFSGTFRFWSVMWFYLVNYLLVAITLGLAYPYTVLRGIRFVVRAVRISGSIDVENLRQNQARKPSMGEGLAAMFAPDGL